MSTDADSGEPVRRRAERTQMPSIPVNWHLVPVSTLRPEDLTLVTQRCGAAIEFTLILCGPRNPTRVLETDEVPPPALLDYLAQLLDVDIGAGVHRLRAG